jgi:hypothetical protein
MTRPIIDFRTVEEYAHESTSEQGRGVAGVVSAVDLGGVASLRLLGT